MPSTESTLPTDARPGAAMPLVAPRPLDSLDRLQVSTQMMVSDYDAATATPMPPVYRSQFRVKNDDGSVQGGAQLKVWAGTAMVVQVAGESVSLPDNADSAPTLTADAFGMLTLTFSPSDISTPLLHAATGDDAVFSTVPDFEVVRGLSRLSGDDLSPEKATGYDGSPILVTRFQGASSRDALADAIANSIGVAGPSATFEAVLEGRPLNPEATAALGAQRGVRPGVVRHWTLALTDDAVFTPSTTEVLAAAESQSEIAFGLFHDFEDFVKDVVDAGKKIIKSAARWAQDSVDFVINTAERAYRFTVKTLEDAVRVVKGLLRSIATAFEAVLEWLSFLFDWDDILRTQRAIEQLVSGRLDSLKILIDEELDTASTQIQDFFGAREADIEQLLGQTQQQNPGSFAAQAQGRGGGTGFSGGGRDASVQVHWLMGRSGLTTPPDATQAAMFEEAFQEDGSMLERLQRFNQTSQDMVKQNPETAGLAAQFQTTVEDLGRLLRNFPNFRSVSVDELLRPLVDISVLAMKAAGLVTSAFLQLVKDLLNDVIDVFTKPLPFSVPFVSDLYRTLTGQELSLIGLGALIVAVPTTIIFKAIHGVPPIQTSEAPLAALTLPKWVGLANAFTYAVLAYTEYGDDTGLFGRLGLAVNLSVIGLLWTFTTLNFVFGGGTVISQLVAIFTLFPLLVGLALLLVPSAAREAYDTTVGPFVTSGYGILLATLHGGLAILDADSFRANVYINLLADVPVAFKALVKIEPDGVPLGRLIIFGLDFVSYTAAGILAGIKAIPDDVLMAPAR